MNYTPNYSMKLPGYGDNADIADLNENTTTIDGLIHDNRTMIAQAYSQLESYVVGDIVENEGKLYRCIGATSGNWDATKWTRTTLGDEVEEAGASALADLDDVNLTTPTEGQILTYDGDDWVNADAPDVDVTKTASGNPIEVSDSASAPLVKCVSAITGYQEGSGTPSPDNIRPITAYTEGKIEVRGVSKNSDYHFVNNYYINASGEIVSSVAYKYTDEYIQINPKISYTVSINKPLANETAVSIALYDENKTFLTRIMPIAPTTQTGVLSASFTVTENTKYIRFSCDISSQSETIQGGTTHTTTFPSAIYRGSEDVVKGEVVTEWGMIDNYAGETLPGEWISDRDEYAPGTTPTTGAQVAYELASPTTSSVTPTTLPVKSLSGYSHIESSTGDMEIEYIAKAFSPITEIVDSQISALQKMMELMLTSARETTMTASANYTAGTLIVACGALYKATTAISSGASLVAGTNITPTTIAAELAALA